MLNKLFFPSTSRHLQFWFVFHLILGFLATLTPGFIIGWFYLVLFICLYKLLKSQNVEIKLKLLIALLFYLVPFEIISRMSNTSPIIPFEMSKYLTFVIFIYGIFLLKKPNFNGFYLVILLIPGIVIGVLKVPDYRYLVFNVLGMINLGLGISFFGGLVFKKLKFDLDNYLRLTIYPLIVSLVCAIIKTPKYDELEFDLGANFDTSGGFGSNQVSTAFGLGLFLIFYLWFNKLKFTGFVSFFDLFFCLLFLFQGLLTFSRGGIIGGILGIILLIFGSIFSASNMLKTNMFYKYLRTIILGIPLILLTLYSVNLITDGKLLLRYQGETTGTLLGNKEITINNFTTGRYDIFIGDIEIFLNNPIFGVGVNQSRYIRNSNEGVVAHVEVSRLLAEHGILGLVIFFIFLYFLVINLKYLRDQRAIIVILFIVGLYTSFHAATRTFISPLIMSLILLPTKTFLNKHTFIKESISK